jgi:hypothetical protein
MLSQITGYDIWHVCSMPLFPINDHEKLSSFRTVEYSAATTSNRSSTKIYRGTIGFLVIFNDIYLYTISAKFITHVLLYVLSGCLHSILKNVYLIHLLVLTNLHLS